MNLIKLFNIIMEAVLMPYVLSRVAKGAYSAYKQSSAGKRRQYFEKYGDYSQNKILTKSMARKSFPVKTVSKRTGRTYYKSKAPKYRASGFRRPGRSGAKVAPFTQQLNGERRVARSKPSTGKSKPKPLSMQVKELSTKLKADQAYHTYKHYYAGEQASSQNACAHTELNISGGTSLEGYMAYLRYFDSGNPGTLVTANAATGSYSREVHFKNVHGRITVRANYKMPAKIKIYVITPKGDTNIAPLTYYANGITDQVIDGGSATTAGLYLTDINVFKRQWNVKLLKDVVLAPGAEVTATHNTGSFDFDPSLFDSHSLEYQPKFKACSFIIRVEGVLGHANTTANLNGITDTNIDYEMFVKADIIYDAGCNLADIKLVDSRDSFGAEAATCTNNPLVTNQVTTRSS